MMLDPKPDWPVPVASPARPPTPPAREYARAKPPRNTVFGSADHAKPTRGPQFFIQLCTGVLHWQLMSEPRLPANSRTPGAFTAGLIPVGLKKLHRSCTSWNGGR